MQRILEPELMLDPDQVKAYAEADFSLPHSDFIEHIKGLTGNEKVAGKVLDLGCGPGDISMRFAEEFPHCSIDAVDGSEPMLHYGRQSLPEHLSHRVTFHHCFLPDDPLPRDHYDFLVCNSLLHHLPDPQVLWVTIKQYTQPGSYVFVMDLLRPDSPAQARELVLAYAADEAEVLRRDFYNSLAAAFTLVEIRAQLDSAQLPLNLEQISDRHVYISGII